MIVEDGGKLARTDAPTSNLAPAYDSTATYAKDDFCVNGGKFYQCNADISTAEAFNPAHWTEVKVTEVMGGGGGVTPEIMAQIENAQWKTEGDVTLFDESVTTATMGPVSIATLSYAKQLTADTLKVTFNGVEYTCNKLNMGDVVQYGARNTSDGYDFSEYPFSIESTYYDGGSVDNAIITETPGTYTVSASAETVTTTETFNSEVQKVAKLNGFVKETSNPSEADFCIVYYSGGDSTETTNVTLGLDGTVGRTTATAQVGEFCAVLWRTMGTVFSSENYYFNYGSELDTPRFRIKSKYMVGDLSDATTNPYIYFVFYPRMNLSLDKLTIKYFCASPDDSGGDSPTTPPSD